jgi:hypothetical protein
MDIQRIFKIKEIGKDGMGDLAAAIIDESYKGMNKKFPSHRHNYWEEKPMKEANLHYAAIDGYISYELYRKIKIINDGQSHLHPKPTKAICPDCNGEDGSSSGQKRQKGPWEW